MATISLNHYDPYAGTAERSKADGFRAIALFPEANGLPASTRRIPRVGADRRFVASDLPARHATAPWFLLAASRLDSDSLRLV
jgi:hypothetical protein